jgi:glutamate/tyrosine decarboxylase-like PLP-dependent enzyme
MDCDVVVAGTDGHGRLRGEDVAAAVAAMSADDAARVFCVVATGGATNTGYVDDLEGIAAECRRLDLWLHVDCAYGGGALLSRTARPYFSGIEQAGEWAATSRHERSCTHSLTKRGAQRAPLANTFLPHSAHLSRTLSSRKSSSRAALVSDSVTIDPHKWLFAPFDCGALLYRDPSVARAAHTQKAEYLEVTQQLRSGVDGGDADAADGTSAGSESVARTGGGLGWSRDALAFPSLLAEVPWNPSDFAHHLTRRPRGLPLWLGLCAHGTDAYRDAVERSLLLAREAARAIAAAPHLQLIMEPQLTVVLFRRRGWSDAEYATWSDDMAAKGSAFVVPSAWLGERCLRLCFVNPVTTAEDVNVIIQSLQCTRRSLVRRRRSVQ